MTSRPYRGGGQKVSKYWGRHLWTTFFRMNRGLRSWDFWRRHWSVLFLEEKMEISIWCCCCCCCCCCCLDSSENVLFTPTWLFKLTRYIFPHSWQAFTECIADLDKLTLDCRDGFKHEYLKDTVSKYMLRVPQYL